MRDGGGGGGGGMEKINDSIYVPSEAVGMIIGKGGETIREMQNNTGCKINVSQSTGPGEVEREIGLVGSRDAINRAKLVIEEKVDAVVSACHLHPPHEDGDQTNNETASQEQWRWRWRRWTWPRTTSRL